jgi:ribosomal protein S18 acetylase RimI-like enzyme
MNILTKKISKSDLRFTFLLRNNRLIRKQSFNSDVITYEKHKEWFFKKLNNKKNLFFIILNKKTKVGVILYDKKEFYYEISISILPKYQLLNIGSDALISSENYLKKAMIISSVKKSNTKSLNFFKKNGYMAISENLKHTLYKVVNQTENKKNKYLIDQIQKIRKKNNVNWMDILRIAFESSPNKTKNVFKNIFAADQNVNIISKKLFS